MLVNSIDFSLHNSNVSKLAITVTSTSKLLIYIWHCYRVLERKPSVLPSKRMVLPIEPPTHKLPPLCEAPTAPPNLPPLSAFGPVAPQTHQHIGPVNESYHLSPLSQTTHLVPFEGSKLMPLETRQGSNSLQKMLGSSSLGISEASSNFMQSKSSLGSNT